MSPRKSRPVAIAPLCLLFLSALLLTGCATFSQKFYIEVAECRPGWRAPHSTFIRLDLSGYAYFTVSKFEKGWYDKSAVDTLFATVTSSVAALNADEPGSKPAAGTLAQAAASEPEDECARYRARRAGERFTRVYGPNGREIKDATDRRLVIFVTGNPDAIVNQISATVNTAEVSRAFVGLLRRGEVSDAANADNALEVAGRRQEAIVIDAEAFSKWLAGAADPLPAQTARDRVSGLIHQIDAELQGR